MSNQSNLIPPRLACLLVIVALAYFAGGKGLLAKIKDPGDTVQDLSALNPGVTIQPLPPRPTVPNPASPELDSLPKPPPSLVEARAVQPPDDDPPAAETATSGSPDPMLEALIAEEALPSPTSTSFVAPPPSPTAPAPTATTARTLATATPASVPTRKPSPPSASPAAPALSSAPSAPTAMEAQLLSATNADRHAAGLPALQMDGTLQTIARHRASTMASEGYFSHTSRSGETAFVLLARAGVRYSTAAENLATNTYAADKSVSVAENGFLGSPSHRANLLSAAFTRVGIGVAFAGGAYYFAVVFVGP